MTRKTILYAEDEYTNRKLMEMQCKKYGIHCILESNGRNALAQCQSHKFDMVVLDQYMPGLNGDEIARVLRYSHPTLPLIAITSDDNCVPKLKANGFDAVFVKPLRSGDYKNLLEICLK